LYGREGERDLIGMTLSSEEEEWEAIQELDDRLVGLLYRLMID